MRVKIHKSVLELVEGDITKQDTEAIVNAPTSGRGGGGGVDGAIHRAGGPQIMEERRKIGGCPTGSAGITTGGRLQARAMLHTVGAAYHGGSRGEAELLASAYRSSLTLASKKGISRIAFPSLSTGAYGYPLDEAARIAIKTVVDYLKDHPEIGVVRFVLFNTDAYSAFETALRRHL